MTRSKNTFDGTPYDALHDRAIGYRRLMLCAALFAAITAPLHVSAQQSPDIGEVLNGQMKPDAEVHTFERSDLLYPVARVARGDKFAELPSRQIDFKDLHFQSDGKDRDLYDYLAINRVAGLLIVKNGQVVLEDYELGVTPQTRWPSFSIAKSVTSTLMGAAIQQGLIASLDDMVTKYVPELRGSAYEAVSLRNLLQMTSGVRWDETYTDPNSDCRKLAEAQSTHKPGASLAYMKGLLRAAAPGTVWNYNSGEINIAGAVVDGATHMDLATYLSRTLWSPLGMEQDATWWTESPHGMALGGVGLSATLRDYARFGMFVAQDGVVQGERIVPAGWFAEAGRSRTVAGTQIDYGYLWWPLPAQDAIGDGAFEAKGIFGQRIYINAKEKLVIVVLSARSKPTGAAILDDDFFAAVVRKLHVATDVQ